MRIDIHGVNLHVHDRGRGDLALVFLHYWGGSSRTWTGVIETLPAGFRTVAIDHRGWGDSDSGDGDYGLTDLARDAQGVIDALGIEHYVLVGHSMGGKVAQLVAADLPKAPAGLVLVAPASPRPSPIPLDQRQRLATTYDARESILAACDQVLTARTLPNELREQVVQDSLRGAAQAKLAWPLRMMMEDITGETARISVPTLIIGGEHDQVDPVSTLQNELLPLIRGARMQVLPGVGHLSPLEAPAELGRRIGQFAQAL